MEISKTTQRIYAPDFELPGVDNQVHHLSRYLQKFKAVAVIFMSNNCSYVNSYIERLKQIQTEFVSFGITLIGINADDIKQEPTATLEAMKIFATEHNLNFPYIRDPNQDVTYCFGTQVTPEVFLLDQKSMIRYQGSIDDSPESADEVKNPYLRNSITALLNNEEINPYCTEALGSPFRWREDK